MFSGNDAPKENAKILERASASNLRDLRISVNARATMIIR